MIKYKIGDRVMNVSDSLVPKNSCGTVSFTTVLGDIIGITWDEIGFHYTHKDLIAPLIDVRIDTNYNLDIEKIAKQVESTNNRTMSVTDELREYKKLLDEGVITQEEFDEKKRELLKK